MRRRKINGSSISDSLSKLSYQFTHKFSATVRGGYSGQSKKGSTQG